MTQASQRAAMKPCNSNSERHLQGDLLREFEERWFALERQTTARPTVFEERRLRSALALYSVRASPRICSRMYFARMARFTLE